MKIKYEKFITRQMMRDNPRSLFIFGDNVCRKGFGGQAKEMRGEPNAFGIATKHAPTYNKEDFFTDSPDCFYHVMQDFSSLLDRLKYPSLSDYNTLVIPQDGIGTGIANLKENAPELLGLINDMLFVKIPSMYSQGKE